MGAIKPTLMRTSAIAGAVVWTVMLFLRTSASPETELINKILVLGILVIVPLGLSLVSTPDRNNLHALPYRLAVLAQPFGAICGFASFFLEQGWPAAALAAAWFVVTCAIALFGLWRLLPRGLRPIEEVSIDAGLIFLPVGGVWFMMSRLGIQPIGFGDTIVLLTAVHFHFAGYAAPILAGLAGRTIGRQGSARKLLGVGVVSIVTGIWFVAAGITLAPRLALAGAIVISTGLVLLAVIVVACVLPSLRSRTAQILLLVSSISSTFAMCLACAYAYSIVTKTVILDIPQMAMAHGIVNAFGFALCGLVGWSMVEVHGGRP